MLDQANAVVDAEKILEETAAATGTPERKKKAQSEQKYDLLAQHVIDHYAETGEQLKYALNDWWVYSDGYWRQYDQNEREMFECLLHEICDTLSIPYAKYRREIATHLQTLRSFKIDTSTMNAYPYVAFQNGTLDVLTGDLVKHSPDHYATRFLDTKFDRDAKCPEWEKMLDRIFSTYPAPTRKRIIGLIQEWFGMALLGSAAADLPRSLRKALFVYGLPYTGKSTILNVLKAIIGTRNVVSSSVSDVTGKQFGLQAFLGREAWITEEVAGLAKLTDPTRLKCLITGETLTVDRKGITSVELEFTGPVAWAANTKPNIGEYSDALYTRVILIEVERVFTSEEATGMFGSKTPTEWLTDQGEIPGIVAWALEGFRRAMSRGQYESIAELSESSADWRGENDPFYAFVRDHCEFDPSRQTEGKALTWCAMGFATAQGWEKLRYAKISREISEAVRASFPGIVRAQKRLDGHKIYLWEGLKIRDSGIRYLDMMTSKDPNADASRQWINTPLEGFSP